MLWENLEREAKKKGLSIHQLSARAGLSKNALYHLKKGRTKDLTFSAICRIADVLGVSVDDLRPRKEGEP